MHNGATPARAVAATILATLEKDENTFSGELLNEHLARRNLSEADAGLATTIVYNVLRQAMWLDFQYRSFLTQAPSRLTIQSRVLLRMAACQKFLLERIPDHAISNETAKVGRTVLGMPERDVRFVHAIVRRILTMSAPVSFTGRDQTARLSLKYSQPPWIVELYRKKFGSDLEAVLAATNLEPTVTLRTNRLRAGQTNLQTRLEREGINTTPGALAADCLILDTGSSGRDLLRSSAFIEGTFYLQDEASQLVSILAGPQPGERILDLCSAPGGKTSHLAELTEGTAQITATDISVARLRQVRENITRLGTPGVTIADYADVEPIAHQPDGPRFDLVLLDAPCSGLGTLRRNPEIRYRCSELTVQRMAAKQRELLSLAAALTAPNGRLVYSTCTITESENGDNIREFLLQNPQFSIAPPSDSLPSAVQKLRGPEGIYRSWPAYLTMDGFEVTVLKRT